MFFNIRFFKQIFLIVQISYIHPFAFLGVYFLQCKRMVNLMIIHIDVHSPILDQ